MVQAFHFVIPSSGATPLFRSSTRDHTGQGLQYFWFPSWCSEPIWNAHILLIAIQVLILPTHGGMEFERNIVV